MRFGESPLSFLGERSQLAVVRVESCFPLPPAEHWRHETAELEVQLDTHRDPVGPHGVHACEVEIHDSGSRVAVEQHCPLGSGMDPSGRDGLAAARTRHGGRLPPRGPSISPDKLAAARQLDQRGDMPARRIAEAMGISRASLYRALPLGCLAARCQGAAAAATRQ